MLPLARCPAHQPHPPQADPVSCDRRQNCCLPSDRIWYWNSMTSISSSTRCLARLWAHRKQIRPARRKRRRPPSGTSVTSRLKSLQLHVTMMAPRASPRQRSRDLAWIYRTHLEHSVRHAHVPGRTPLRSQAHPRQSGAAWTSLLASVASALRG